MNKKGYTVKDLLPVALILTVSIIAVTIGADVVNDVNADQTADSYADNISTSGLEGLDELGSWFPTIGLVIAAAIVIGVLVYSFAFRS